MVIKKIHRVEPRVMMRRPESCDERSYMFVATTEKEVRAMDKELEEWYPDNSLRAAVRENCHIDGVLFDRRSPRELLWHFDEFDQFAYSCWKNLCDAAAGSCEILLTRKSIWSQGLGDESK